MSTRRFSTMLSWAACGVLLASWWLSTGPAWDRPAAADMISSSGGFTLMTANSRDQRVVEEAEVLYLLDHHRGMLMVYGLVNVHTEPRIEMLDGGRMEVLFERARATARRATR
jgi:hypothetical protein